MSPGTTLPPFAPRAYRIEAFIGKGGFGQVYLARNLAEGALGRVALKVLDEGAAEPWVARFFHEAQVLASLSDYPCFVRVNAVFKMERRFCIEMEYIPGVTLDALIARGPLPIPAALHLARQTAVALDVAWTRARDEQGALLRVLHRDLKPGNLRVTPSGAVKVLDFGLARSDLRGLRPETLRVLPGTLAYMAPERFGFRSDFGHQADVYALGQTLYEMLTGEAFFDLDIINPCLPPEHETLSVWTEGRMRRMERQIGPHPELRALLESALAIDPDERLSAADLEGGLRRLGGVGLEDEVRAWVEGALGPLVASLPPPAGADPAGWVRTIRRSDVDSGATPAPDTLEPTLLPAQEATLPVTPDELPLPPEPRTQTLPKARNSDRLRWTMALFGAAAVVGTGAWLALRAPPEPLAEAPPLAAEPAPVSSPTELPAVASAMGEPAAPPTARVAPRSVPVRAVTPASTTATVALPPAPAITEKPAAEVAPAAPTGAARMVGEQATSVHLEGPGSATLKPGDSRDLPAGSYSARVSFDGGDYPLEVTVKAGETLVFDCTKTRMGSPCSVR